MEELDAYAIRVDSLTKVYPIRGTEGKRAVDQVSFEVERGGIFGLLGPNGAGKTTTIKMLTTLLLPTSGTVEVLGMDVTRNVREVRSRINLVSGGERGLYYRLTARQNLRFFSDLYRVRIGARDKRIDELLDLVGLQDSKDVRVEDYSRGMKQRLHIARSLVNDPEVLFLDEPTIGLDPEISRDIRGIIKGMAEDGRTIMLTTHYMHEAEELCGMINVIANGRVIAKGTPSDLKDMVRRCSIVEIEVREHPGDVMEALRSVEDVDDAWFEPRAGRYVIRARVDADSDVMVPLAERARGLGPIRISLDEPTLEDAYISLVRSHDQP